MKTMTYRWSDIKDMIVLLYVLLHLIVAAFIGLKVEKLTDTFYLMAEDHEELEVMSQYFSRPVMALIFLVIFLVVGLTLYGTIPIILEHFMGKTMSITVSLFLYLLLVVDLHKSILGMFSPGNFILFHHALASGIPFYVYTFADILILAGILWLMSKYWWKSLTFRRPHLPEIFGGVQQWYIKTLFTIRNAMIILVITALSVITKIIFGNRMTLPDLLIHQFWGMGSGYFYTREFLDMLLYNLVPIYLLCVFYQRAKRDSSLSVVIRLRRKSNWVKEILKTGSMFCIIYTLVTIAITIILGLVFQLKPAGYLDWKLVIGDSNAKLPEIVPTVWEFFVSKSLELIFLFVLILLIDSFLHNTAIAFSLLVVLHGISILPFQVLKYNPVGVAFLARRYGTFSGDGMKLGIMAGILLLPIGAGWILLRYFRLNQMMEEN
jgi:hypothetical protein